MTYNTSEKYGLGRRNKNALASSHITASSNNDTSDVNSDFNNNCDSSIAATEKPIFVIFNPKSLDISAESLNAYDLRTRKLTGLQLGSTFLKEYDTNIAVQTIAKEESEEPKPKPYKKQIICFTTVTGGLLRNEK